MANGASASLARESQFGASKSSLKSVVRCPHRSMKRQNGESGATQLKQLVRTKMSTGGHRSPYPRTPAALTIAANSLSALIVERSAIVRERELPQLGLGAQLRSL